MQTFDAPLDKHADHIGLACVPPSHQPPDDEAMLNSDATSRLIFGRDQIGDLPVELAVKNEPVIKHEPVVKNEW